MKKFIRWSSQHRLVRLCLLGAFFLFLAVKIVNSIDYRNSDFFSFWLAGHMMWTGQDPYFTNDWIQGHNEFGATWISDPRFLYPLPLAFLFAPLGLLPLYYAFIVWIFLLESMISFSAFSLINLGENPKKAHFLVPVLISIAIFRPAFIAVLNGQISGWLLFVMVSVILLWNKNSNSLGGGVLLTLVALKPNIGIPVIALISIWLLVNKRFNVLAGIAISGITLILIGIAIKPNWVAEYLSIGSDKLSQAFGYSPALWGLAALIARFNMASTLILGCILVSIALLTFFYFARKRQHDDRPVWIVSLAITTTLLITPYTWPYDQVLLIIPIIAIIGELIERKFSFLITSTVFIFFDILAIILFALSVPLKSEALSGLLPLSVLCALIYFMLRKPNETALATSAA